MNFATFDLNLLRVLDAILREGTTVKAGMRLGLSQSAVSGALSRLRSMTGDILFVRRGNRLVPTEYAQALEHPVRQHLEELEQLLSAPAAFDPAHANGTFRITASDFFADLLMPRLADHLNRHAPGIRAQLVDLVPYDYVESLERYRADLALMPAASFPDWVESTALFNSSFVAMGDAALERIGRRRKVVMTLPVFSGVCRAVSESDLIALVPRQIGRHVAEQLGIRTYRPPMPIEPALIVGVWHKRASRTPFQIWMRDLVAGMLRPLNEGEGPLPAS